MRKLHRTVALMAAVCLLAALAACGAPSSSAPASTAPPASTPAASTPAESTPADAGAETFDLNVNLASEPESIDPALNSAVDGAVMAHHFFEGLLRWADDGSGALAEGHNNSELVPGQAESWDKAENADGTVTYTFHLRDGIKWSDGQPVTAGDFEYSWKRVADPTTGSPYSYIISGIIKGAAEIMAPDDPTAEDLTFENAADPDTLAVTAVDDTTLEVVLESDCPYFLELCAFPTLFPVREDFVGNDQWTFNPATYIGNGPYKMTEREVNSHILSVKNEQYYDYAELGPDSIRYVMMDDQNAMLTGFRSGELDFIEDMPVDEIPALADSGDLHIVDYIGTYYLSINITVEPFTDARVREALVLAIDRNHIVNNITRTGQLPADSFVPPGISDADGSAFSDASDYYSVDEADYAANCERARELLADAGYPEGAGFPTVEYLYNTSDAHRMIGEAMQADWLRELGINVTLNNQDWAVVLQNRREGNYQLTRDAWISDFNDPISFLDMYISGSGNNNAQLRSPEYDQLIADSRAESDPAARMAILHEAEDYLMNNYIVGPIYSYTNKYMLTPGIEGLYYSSLGYFFFDRLTKTA